MAATGSTYRSSELAPDALFEDGVVCGGGRDTIVDAWATVVLFSAVVGHAGDGRSLSQPVHRCISIEEVRRGELEEKASSNTVPS